MRIAVVGATGHIGSRIATEAAARGHAVTRISRRGGDGIVAADAFNDDTAREIASAHDVVVDATTPDVVDDGGDSYLDAVGRFVRGATGTRIVRIGGAGSLDAGGGRRLYDTDEWPEEWRASARINGRVLDWFRTQPDSVDWTVVAPSHHIEPGERTGAYRVSDDTPAGDRISSEDFAVAVLDEIETPAHRRSRFTAAN